MVRDHGLVLCFALSFVIFSEASPHLSVALGSSDPHEVRSFKANHNHTQDFLWSEFGVILPNIPFGRTSRVYFTFVQQNAGSCSYTVTVTTSCSSPDYTRDQISLSFGDAYGNQVYAPRIDDPSSRAFERCSVDEFEIYGPCTYQVCYVYLYRSGYDGWMPETVTIYGYYTRAVTFYYNTFIPYGVWFGFDYCGSSTSSKSSSVSAM